MAHRPVPDRVRWAVDLLAPAPHARILEIGGGPGAAAELICGLLVDGTMHLIDRSAVAIERTVERNHTHIRAGRLRVSQLALADLTPGLGSYDLAFALNVNTFWTHPDGPELMVLHEALVPGGGLAILYGPGPTPAHDDDHLTTIAGAVTAAGFAGVRIVRESRGSGVICVRPPEADPTPGAGN